MSRDVAGDCLRLGPVCCLSEISWTMSNVVGVVSKHVNPEDLIEIA